MAEAATPRRIIDISSPGETAPNASSRPVLVSHKPAVQDPMMSTPPANRLDNQPSQPRVSTPAETPIATAKIAPEENPPQPEPTPINQPDVKQLVHDKTYFMPVGQSPGHHGLSWVLALAALLISIATAYIALAT